MARYGYRSPKDPHVVMTIRRPGYAAVDFVVTAIISFLTPVALEFMFYFT
jgi:hypothetical protein